MLPLLLKTEFLTKKVNSNKIASLIKSKIRQSSKSPKKTNMKGPPASKTTNRKKLTIMSTMSILLHFTPPCSPILGETIGGIVAGMANTGAMIIMMYWACPYVREHQIRKLYFTVDDVSCVSLF